MSVYRQVREARLPALRIGDPDKGRLIIPAQAVQPDVPDAIGEQDTPYYRLAAAARFFGVSYGHLHREVQGGRFPGMRLRTVWLIPAAAIDAMVREAIDRNGVVLASEFGDWAASNTAPVPRGMPAACRPQPNTDRSRPVVP
jgi:hypothetical protein